MPANQKQLNQTGMFWYQFTPRKLLYDISKFGQVWSTFMTFFFFFFFFGGGSHPV